MLSKVDQLSNIGRFASLRHRAEGFARLALLFARNGYGKTTICAVLRSAIAQNSRPIDERAHLGGSGTPSAVLQFDPSTTVAFNNGTWNRTMPPILVFDQEYVKANVHAAEEVTRNNKRQLFQVIIGAAGVTLAERISNLDAENATVNAAIRTAEAAIKAAAPVVTDVASFVNNPVPDDLDQRIAAATRTALQAERTADIQRRAKLLRIDLGSNPLSYLALLAEEVGGGLTDVAAAIERHRAKHELPDARWLRYGVEHVHGDDCPFCDQDLATSAVIESLRAMFGEEYRNLADRLDVAHRVIATAANGGGESAANIYQRNAELHAFWGEVIEIPPLPAVDTSSDGLLLRWMEQALGQRAGNPSMVVRPTADQSEEWEQLTVALTEYNHAIDGMNAAIALAKSETGRPTGDQAAAACKTRDKYLVLARRDVGALADHCAAWTAATLRHREIAMERKAAQDALRGHVASTAANYEDSINELLGHFGCNFRLCQNKASYVGGQPNIEYCIDINGHVLPVGESGTNAVPCFRTVLSAGDKSSLALALFVTQVRQRSDLADLTLVFDDPFNSQDAGRQFETAARIRELAAEVRQVIVLSHDARFLHLIRKDADQASCSEHQVVMNGDWVGEIRVWSSVVELKSDYVRRAEQIRHYSSTGRHLPDCTPAALAGDLRVFVEEYVDLRFPGRFAARETLGVMVDQIDAAGPSDPLYSQRRALRELNEYSRPDHHRGTSAPDPDQLRAQCRKVIQIVGAY